MSAPKVGFVSLGCPKALVDSERILTQLRAEGYDTAPDYAGAKVVIVNTCGFIDSAVEESLEAIGEAMAENGKVIVTGCMGVGSHREKIRERFPDVLSISGPQDFTSVMTALHQAVPPQHDPFLDLVPPQGIKLTPRHYAYLKISEGCNHKCSFCIIPSMRGKLVSRPIDEVLREGERLVKAGVRELLVISQDTSAYGVDLKYAPGTWQGREYRAQMKDLCEGLGSLDAWVRLHYVYPYPHVDEIIPLMAQGKVLPYLDIPFQHGSPSVLKRMKRPAFAENTLARIRRWREICPDITIRSTFIVGFPGETEAEFDELLDWLEAAQLDRVGCFTYSPVEGAAANGLADPVPPELQQERQERFMALQSEISAAKLQAKIGQEIDVMIDGFDEDGYLVGRSQADAPEIDGRVYLASDGDFQPGQIVRAEVIAADEHDLNAEVID
ncbi:MAG: 30S ribosomal protein S12 methylthiotransferase RimO [Polycyclovorans sp.]|jgi:ribosomal protein S12 methylthiotransferase|nr:30S ribosomal protein S12 methylthiotransferase RimO [Polycyclovorans sp.]MBU0791192.1 30S ribosomal protein S12 methylthiotransferase RimO [Gammaproteobacteria bacterium]MDP1542599.1 30S ribosomal protein S12 methylthiotransferase RimO [Polycyclovorans sp.]MEC8849968.1 30S ribosomal protein S12 methylthiotransferase RimO [Pseudomonadota bacterium]|tara:strand:- start:15866 stop:17188 length:1323 start_codon:yes stop_codon:yes gene_type:complete